MPDPGRHSGLRVHVEAIGLIAPGLAGWNESQPILRGDSSWLQAPIPPFQPLALPPNERRRLNPAVRLAFQIADDLGRTATRPLATLASVFATSEADMLVLDRICRALARPEQQLSPTDFHNSVHNAGCGYWSIAAGNRRPATTVSGYDGSFAIGLLEAATWLVDEEPAALLLTYDCTAPEPLAERRQIAINGGCALLLAAEPSAASIASLTLNLETTGTATAMREPELDRLRTGTPGLRPLPLLTLLARRQPGQVHIEYSGTQTLRIDVECR
jgi:hypothetical protein